MDVLPLFPLGSALLPGSQLPLHIFEPRYRQLVTDLVGEDLPGRRFGVVAIRQGWEVGEDNVDSMYDVGCSALLDQVRQLPGGQYDINANGERRFRLLQIDRSAAPYLMADIEWLPDTAPENDSPARREHLTTAARAAYQRYHDTGLRGGQREAPSEDTDAAALSYLLADDCVLTVEDRQQLLEETDPLERLRNIRRLLLREAEFLRELRAVPAPLTDFVQHTSVN